MRIVAFTTSWWDNQEAAQRLLDPLFGLRAWFDRVTFLFKPIRTFLACGTWSDPAFNPLAGLAEVVNAGLPVGTQYNVFRSQCCMAAYTAAMAHLLNRNDWDYVVLLDTDCLVGAVNFPKLFSDFAGRPDYVLTNAWNECPAGSMMIFKREGCVRFLHQRIQGNIALDASPDLILGETEMKIIFNGVWWNPWPEVKSVRQDFSVNPNDPNPMRLLGSPFIRQPHPKVVDQYLKTQWSKVVPL
jgi:hypothetical protein